MTFEPEQGAAQTNPETGGGAPHEEHLTTTDHDVIRQWAEDRHATPATLEGAEHDGRLDVLRFDFGFGMVEAEEEELREVSWEDWFRTFDEQGLSFTYHDTRPDGSRSNFFRLDQAAGGAR